MKISTAFFFIFFTAVVFSQSGAISFTNASVNYGVTPNSVSETLTSTSPNITVTVTSYDNYMYDNINIQSFARPGTTGNYVVSGHTATYGMRFTFSSAVDVSGITVIPLNFTASSYNIVIAPNTGTPVIISNVAPGTPAQPTSLGFTGITSFTVTTTTVTTYNGSPGNFFFMGADDIILGAPLPVELVLFTAHSGTNSIELKWNTATETNNYGFEIERMNRTGNDKEEWQKVGFVEGAGNSNSPQQYSFSDKNPGEGKYNYRLKQIDNDGAFEYSDIVEAVLLKPEGFSLEQNYPNPFNPATTIGFTIQSAGLTSIKIYDMLGSEVAVLADNFLDAGNYNITWDASAFPSGVYFYKLQSGNYTETKQMLLLK